MRSCCVEGCVVPSEDTKFFEFPTSRTLRQRWLDVVSLAGRLTLDSKVCSQHFAPTDYELVRGKTRLKRKVVPTLLLSKTPTSPEPIKTPEQNTNGESRCSPPKSPEKNRYATRSSRARQKSANEPPDIPQTRNETPSPNSIDSKCPRESENVEESLKDQNPNSPDIEKSSESNINDEIDKMSEPTDIEEELNKLQEEKRKSEVLKRKTLSKLSEGLSKISERLIRISDGVKTSSVLTNGHSECDEFSIKHGVSLGKERLSNLIHNADPKTADIEEMITNYQIKNKIPNNALAVDLEEMEKERLETEREQKGPVNGDVEEIEVVPDIENDVAPVFIAISVDKDATNQEQPGETGDCMMLLESVQCEVDPASLMLPEPEDDITITSDDDDDDQPPAHKRKEDPISLLTSSDEDDVIIEEPHIDTVEVSDETDEDDLPLTKLVRTQPTVRKIKDPKRGRQKKDALQRIMWGMYEFYCVQCHFTCTSKKQYKEHLEEHSKVLQVCTFCSYTTSSKAQYRRHVRSHKGEKRFKCHLCEYKARHNMSLIYHLKTHEGASTVNVKRGRGYKCKKCSFRSDVKSVVLRHVKSCSSSGKVFKCNNCEYETARRSDLRRHKKRKHKDDDDDDDEEYKP